MIANRRSRIVMPAMVLFLLAGCSAGTYEVATFNKEVITNQKLLSELKKNSPSSLTDSALTKESVNDFLDRYITYRLKVEDGKSRGYDQDSTLLSEFDQYKKTLAQNRVMDGTIKKSLVEELYNRRQKLANASHILIQYNATKSQGDSTVPWLRINGIKKEIAEGLDFTEAAKKYSEDPSAKMNGGDLGWFAGGDMVYPFENAVYSAKIDSVIGPVRTNFGYHLIKVHGFKDAPAPRYASHIMQMFGEDKDTSRQQFLMDSAMVVINKGGSFDELVQLLSEDIPSKQNRGSLGEWKASGRVPQFDAMIYDSLKVPGQISPVVRTRWGFHIIRLDSIGKLPTLEQDYDNLAKLVSRQSERLDSRKMQLFTDLKVKHSLAINDSLLSEMTKALTAWRENPKDTSGANIQPATVIAGLKDQIVLKSSTGSFTADELFSSAEGNGVIGKFTKSEESNRKMLNQAVADLYLQNYMDNLEKYDPEFIDIVSTFKDGLVLFKWMENVLWKPGEPTDEELEAILAENKESFMWPERGVFHLFSVGNIQKADSLLKKPVVAEEKPVKGKKKKQAPVAPQWKAPETFEELYRLMQANGLVVTSDTLVLSQTDGESATKLWTKPFQQTDFELTYVTGRPCYVYFAEKLPPGPKSLEDARAELTRIFNERLTQKREEELIASMKKNAAIQINQEAVARFVSEQRPN